MSVVLRTIHGSHLYGLAHAGSDRDSYQVVTHSNTRYARQTKHGHDDQITISLDRFLEQVSLGTPQALEALWSPLAQLDPTWAPLLHSLQPGIADTQMRYRRTIVNFGLHCGGRTGSAAERVDTRKLRRHAIRLALNLHDFMVCGHFNPYLSPRQVAHVTTVADAPDFKTQLQKHLEWAQWSQTS